MHGKLADGLSIGASRIHGRGCFATRKFIRRKKIADYAGEHISDIEAERRAARRKILRVCSLNNGYSLDGARGGNGTHYINHSCQPNAFMQTRYGRLEFYALHDIAAGVEITVDYIATHHDDDEKCVCKAERCRGTINRK